MQFLWSEKESASLTLPHAILNTQQLRVKPPFEPSSPRKTTRTCMPNWRSLRRVRDAPSKPSKNTSARQKCSRLSLISLPGVQNCCCIERSSPHSKCSPKVAGFIHIPAAYYWDWARPDLQEGPKSRLGKFSWRLAI